jgi:hypothetical protein
MNHSTQNILRLLLIAAMVLTPVQSAFSMQMSMHMGSAATATSNHVHSVEPQMLGEGSTKHDDCGNCQGSTHCSSCFMALAIFQMSSIHNDMGTQFHVAISGVSINSTDLLPDYRPPRFS